MECGELSLAVACGPFTPDNTNDYAPLNDLLEEVQKAAPDLLILVSPLVMLSQLIHTCLTVRVTGLQLLATSAAKCKFHFARPASRTQMPQFMSSLY